MSALLERFKEVSDEIRRAGNITVTEKRDGDWHAVIAENSVTVPPLAEMAANAWLDLVKAMAVRMEEFGHILAPRDGPVGHLYREAEAATWAAVTWQRYKLPHYEEAE